jgi:hypothetical protein
VRQLQGLCSKRQRNAVRSLRATGRPCSQQAWGDRHRLTQQSTTEREGDFPALRWRQPRRCCCRAEAALPCGPTSALHSPSKVAWRPTTTSTAMADALEQLRQKVAKAEQVPASERSADMQMWLEGLSMAQEVAEVFTTGPLSPESSLWRWAAHQATRSGTAAITVDGLLVQVSARAQPGGCGGRPGSWQ